MNDTIKITTEELNEFNKLKDDIQSNIFNFGKLYFEKMELDNLYKALSEKETNLRNESMEYQKKETVLMESILKKYGEGSLNVKNGVFTPS